MTEPLRHWRVWCETESQNVFAWSQTAPTTCPNNAAHTITASKTAAVNRRNIEHLLVDPLIEPVVPGASRVVINDRPALEVQNGVTGWGSVQAVYPHTQNDEAKACCCIGFVLEEAGTGGYVRIAARLKADAEGDDSSGSWDDTEFVAVAVTHTTPGEVFIATVELDISGADEGDAIAFQVGRDGDNDLGSGTNDNCDVAIAIISLEVKAI